MMKTTNFQFTEPQLNRTETGKIVNLIMTSSVYDIFKHVWWQAYWRDMYEINIEIPTILKAPKSVLRTIFSLLVKCSLYVYPPLNYLKKEERISALNRKTHFIIHITLVLKVARGLEVCMLATGTAYSTEHK